MALTASVVPISVDATEVYFFNSCYNSCLIFTFHCFSCVVYLIRFLREVGEGRRKEGENIKFITEETRTTRGSLVGSGR